MFTGIVQGVARVAAITDRPGLRSFELAFDEGFDAGLAIGASVACDGVCLTVTARPAPDRATFDVMQQSLGLTTLATLAPGSRLNVERAARDGAEIGGHPISGHIDCQARLLAIRRPENNLVLRIGVPDSHLRYVFAKGYIAVNGASLTVAETDRRAGWFEVWLIPETLRMTTFGDKREGDTLNLEIERGTQVVVDTVRDALDERLGPLLPALEALLRHQGSSVDELGAALAVAVAPARLELAGEGSPTPLARDAAPARPLAGPARVSPETDALTGLGNRLHLTRCLMGKLDGGGKVFLLAYIGLSRTPPRRENVEPQAELRADPQADDEVLRVVARRIQRQLREVDSAVHMDGDEFVLLFQGLADGSAARERIQALAAQLSQPIHLRELVVSVAVHVGLAAFPLDGRTEAALLLHADRALAAARRAGQVLAD